MTKILTNSYTATSGFTSTLQQKVRGLARKIMTWAQEGREDQIPARLRYDAGMDDRNPDTMRRGTGSSETMDAVNAMMRSRPF